jgi:hypothetical protein
MVIVVQTGQDGEELTQHSPQGEGEKLDVCNKSSRSIKNKGNNKKMSRKWREAKDGGGIQYIPGRIPKLFKGVIEVGGEGFH